MQGKASGSPNHVMSLRSKVIVASAQRTAVPPAKGSPPVTPWRRRPRLLVTVKLGGSTSR